MDVKLSVCFYSWWVCTQLTLYDEKGTEVLQHVETKRELYSTHGATRSRFHSCHSQTQRRWSRNLTAGVFLSVCSTSTAACDPCSPPSTPLKWTPTSSEPTQLASSTGSTDSSRASTTMRRSRPISNTWRSSMPAAAFPLTDILYVRRNRSNFI